MTLVSVITPSFNQAAFLEETIQSVLSQEYPDIEYIIVDGGSTDGSVDIIRNYAEKLAWWVSEPDSGQADAINKGFAHAKGDIIAWINSDDYYLPNAIAAAVHELEPHPEAGLIYGNVLSIDEHGVPIYLQRFRPYTLEDLLRFRIISQPGVFMRRAALEAAGLLDLSYRYLLDHHLWIRIAARAPIHYIPKTLAAARYHAEAKNVAHAEEFGEEAFRILAWAQRDSTLAKIIQKDEKKFHAGAHRLDAFYLVESGNMRQGLAAYARALKLDPVSTIKSCWKRILYAAASLLGLSGLRKGYLRVQKFILRGAEHTFKRES